MQFTGVSSIYLPQKSGFSFAISNINLSNIGTGLVGFIFSDTGNNQINIQCSGGNIAISPDLGKTISTYSTNSLNLLQITGFYQNNVLNYQINGIFGQNNYNFGPINTFSVSGLSSPVFADIYFYSNPINYYVNFSTVYYAGQLLTGTISSDTEFYINSIGITFLNSNFYNLLSGVQSNSIISTGSNYITFQDIDPSAIEYNNNYSVVLNSPFGNIGGNFQSYRGNVYSQSLFNISDFSSNQYFLESLFNGSWSGNSFTYVDNPLTYSISFHLQNVNVAGYEIPTQISVKFSPSYPLNNSGYIADYITGFSLTNSGLYSGIPPIAQFAEYYYVTGINQQLQNMLFSTGCSSGIKILFSGPDSGAASGFLGMSLVNISGAYGTGISAFNIVEGYNAYDSGSGYTVAPTVIWSTGGNCYSLPDVSGIYAHFQKISGLQGSILGQAYGATGFPLTSGISGTGFIVTGIQMTNVGYGYNNLYPPKVTFQRWTGDSLINNASGILNYKTTGIYNFTGVWDISYNFLNSTNTYLNNYGSFYSGDLTIPSGANVINFQINLSNLDNTTPISGLLTLQIPYSTGVITMNKNIIESRYFNLNTGALYNYLGPINPFTPVNNISIFFTESQQNSQYFNDFNNL